ncbi:copper chaperone taha [Boletus coccyginus]|nr:copper chaperone taha [Boletus coccyginus]
MGEYKFNVKMTCGGCSKAVERALSRVEGITYTVSLEEQQVVVKGGVPYDEVLGKIQKTGKEVLSGEVVQA